MSYIHIGRLFGNFTIPSQILQHLKWLLSTSSSMSLYLCNLKNKVIGYKSCGELQLRLSMMWPGSMRRFAPAKGYSLSKPWSSAIKCCAQKLYVFHFWRMISFLPAMWRVEKQVNLRKWKIDFFNLF